MGLVPAGLLPWAVHISDGVLTVSWLAGGFLVAGALALLAAFRVRDEEVPRIALLTAAFFVASLIHVRLGPTSVHLLLNGLVGVLLGRRAPLAILVGLFLQAALLGHGGFTTLGVNACVLGVPALLAGGLFALLHRTRWVRHPVFRGVLVAVSAFAWILGLVFTVVLLATNRWTAVQSLDPGPALRLTLHPLTLALAGLVALAAAWVERWLDNAPEFSLGLLVGVLAVLLTLFLNAAVLLWGGAEDWHAIVLLVFIAHMPIVVIESIVLGFAVGFLARVKPEMLDGVPSDPPSPPAAVSSNGALHHPTPTPREERPAPVAVRPPTVLLAMLTLQFFSGRADAHRLEAEYRVLPGGRVRIESWFDLTGDSPHGASVKVYRPDNTILTEGRLDDQGQFVFPYGKAEDLRVVIAAGAGHSKELTIPSGKLPAPASAPTAAPGGPAGDHRPNPAKLEKGATWEQDPDVPPADRNPRVSVKDVLIGVAFLLAAGAFYLSLRNARELREMRRRARGVHPEEPPEFSGK